MPAFAFRQIKDLYPVFWSKARELVQALTAEASLVAGNSDDVSSTPLVVEITGWAGRATLDIIGLAGMGHDFGTIQNPDSKLFKAYQAMLKPSNQEMALGLLAFILPAWLVRCLPVKRNATLKTSSEIVKEACRDLVRERTAQLNEDKSTRLDILSVAIRSGGFSESGLVNQLMTFLFAGFETTAAAVTWATYALSIHPDVQSRLRAEVRAHIASIDKNDANDITSDDIEGMPYLHAVCNEVLRFYAPAPAILREAICDTSILGQYVPAGTILMISPWAVNRSISLWGADANEFRPDRWLGPGRANTGGVESNYSFLTFLHGPRSCIGQGFAKAEFACVVAALVGRFEMQVGEEHPDFHFRGGVSSKPPNGLRIQLKVVEGW